ncbi:hypothetical protein MBANPS3_011994 [Mucor bainieri]
MKKKERGTSTKKSSNVDGGSSVEKPSGVNASGEDWGASMEKPSGVNAFGVDWGASMEKPSGANASGVDGGASMEKPSGVNASGVNAAAPCSTLDSASTVVAYDGAFSAPVVVVATSAVDVVASATRLANCS